MPTQANVVPPSLVNELSEMNRRISAIERAPAPVSKFDRYPAIEWAAQGRPPVGGNVWSSVSIANVTGLTFDRLECKFITDFLIKGKCEAEVRLAAYRHNSDTTRQIVSASRTLQLKGATERYVGSGIIRWIHGIPFGWDYEDNNTVYTVELQHRYAVGPQPVTQPMTTDVFVFSKDTDKTAPSTGGALEMPNNNNYETMVLPKSRPNVTTGWVTVPTGWQNHEQEYGISAMHYCVGLPQARIPEATARGWAWLRNMEAAWTREPDLTEPDFGV
ncbi:hypothetical protein NJL88_08950 [Streptomyces sp. DK15]|uniref:hypothetical protein n=1 Tax=Streptomyces sp. DK15 TaxID=2957499 RepID=UPI0029AE73F8|nr:hypothetical protein [Streptomyces sp. DK15]MDX2390191.1 hypothetical protein [Streptomyces sp. DK15]